MHHLARLGAPPQPGGQHPARGRADGHQQLHVAGERLQRVPAGFVKTRAEPELHRCGEQELHPRRQHPVFAKQVAHHGQGQRRREQQAREHGQEVGGDAVPAFAAVFVHGGHGPRLVAGVAHRALDARQGLGVVGACERHARRLGGQVHARTAHAGLFLQHLLHARDAGSTGHAANAQVNLAKLGRFGHDTGVGHCGQGIHGSRISFTPMGRSSDKVYRSSPGDLTLTPCQG
ncbi:hypothetical protein D9M69_552740 [compost metagenome]